MPDVQTPKGAAIAIAATFTAEPLLVGLRFVLHEAGVPFDVCFAPYNQLFQELLSPTSLLATNSDGVNVVLVRVEDFTREVQNTEQAVTIIRRVTRDISEALSHYADRVKVPTVFAVLPTSPRVARALRPDLEAANMALAAHARSLPGISPLMPEDIDIVSPEQRYDDMGDELAHMPFSEEHYASIALAIGRKVHALRVPAHKVLVLDCDDTLWRGIVGEDGIDGVTLSPGRACLQQFAVKLQAQGVLVCLASKNTEHDVLEVFEKRSDMPLKIEHILAHRINWEPKPRNVVSLARALNLGLDSFVFIDDSPVECAAMRAELPQVVTLQLPPDDEIESFLSHLWTFDKATISAEDVRRTNMYREDVARQELKHSTTNLAEFIASLGLTIDVAPLEEGEWPRAAQLTQRTNQFNFTTVRRTEPEIRALVSGGSTVLRVKVRDRFGDYGLVGLVILDQNEDALVVDTLLLSCRVLGRGVEHAVLRRLGEIARQRALGYVHLSYVPTSKNEPARAFAESVAARFQAQEQNRVVYRIPVEDMCAIENRPVIDDRKSEEDNSLSSNSTSSVDRSGRYARFGQALLSGRSVLRAARALDTRARTLPGEPEPPTTDTERRLLALWQELLNIDVMGVNDDYFALGGTSLVAARLFAEIVRRFGVRLPLTTILETPTVRALSRRLEQHQTSGSGALITLKRGGQRNLFLVHDGDGETLLYLNLARRMPEDLAVFGIKPRRISRVPLAHVNIEDMAAFYIEEVCNKQPHGPYLLGGMCAGGVIAYEMASQLVRAGESVELVALLDAATPQALKRPGRVTKQRLGRMKQALSRSWNVQHRLIQRARLVTNAVWQKLFNALIWEISQLSRQCWVNARFRLLRWLLARQLAWPRIVSELSVRQIYDSAEAHYVPRSLPGSIVLLLRAQAGEASDEPYRHIYADEAFGWDVVAPGLKIVDVHGGHSSMLQEPFVESLAKALMLHLSQTAVTTHAHTIETAML